MLDFEFDTIGRQDGRRGSLHITIFAPRRLEAAPHDFECRIQFCGVIEKETRVVGVFPFQAVDLALFVTKAIIASYTSDWELFHDGSGPVTLDYLDQPPREI